MATAKPEAPETQVDAASPEKQPAPTIKQADENTIIVNTWCRAGEVKKGDVLERAKFAVRNAVPVTVYDLEAKLIGATKTEYDKAKGTEAGTDFQVSVTYSLRANAAHEEPVDLERVIQGLEVSGSLDGLHGHEGDPDFHSKKPDEF